MRPCLLFAVAGLLAGIAATGAPAPLRNGVYAVVRDTPNRAEAAASGAHQRQLVYDRKYSDADRDQPPRYVVIDTSAFVPMILAGPPDARKDERGWTALSVTLAREHIRTLADFSQAHLGGTVAIVLDGEIVTIHKVRSVITDGHFQISRCTDNACQVLKAKLAEK